jgi:hypothetical protein
MSEVGSNPVIAVMSAGTTALPPKLEVHRLASQVIDRALPVAASGKRGSLT